MCGEIVDTMKLLGCDKKYLDGTASDFECFREWLSAYPHMHGNSVAEQAAKKMSELFEQSITEKDLCTVSAKEIWQAFEQERKINFCCGENLYKEYNFARVCDSEKKRHLLSCSADLNTELERCACEGVSEFEEFVKYLENTGKYTFSLNVPDTDFIRSDRYHAGGYYTEYIRGEKDNYEKISVVLLQAIFELIFRNKCVIIQLYMTNERCINWVKELAKYLSLREISVPVALFVNKKSTPEEIRGACLLYDKMTLVLPFEEGENLEGFFKALPKEITVFETERCKNNDKNE